MYSSGQVIIGKMKYMYLLLGFWMIRRREGLTGRRGGPVSARWTCTAGCQRSSGLQTRIKTHFEEREYYIVLTLQSTGQLSSRAHLDSWSCGFAPRFWPCGGWRWRDRWPGSSLGTACGTWSGGTASAQAGSDGTGCTGTPANGPWRLFRVRMIFWNFISASQIRKRQLTHTSLEGDLPFLRC